MMARSISFSAGIITYREPRNRKLGLNDPSLPVLKRIIPQDVTRW
jgi:hypothetical protein